MNYSHRRALTSLLLGVSFCLIYSVLLRGSPWLQQLESKVYDNCLLWHSHLRSPEEILLVKFDSLGENSNQVEPNLAEQLFYVSLVEQLLDGGAAVVVLNLRDRSNNWWSHQNIARSWQKLIEQHGKQIAIATPINNSEVAPQSDSAISDTQNEIAVSPSPETIQGFIKYDFFRSNTSNIAPSLRQLDLVEKFVSAPLLAVKKYDRQLNSDRTLTKVSFPERIGVGYWNNFASLDLREICTPKIVKVCQLNPETNLKELVTRKIVIVGKRDRYNLNTLAVRATLFDRIPLIEFEANIIASLISARYYRILPTWCDWSISFVGAIIVCGLFICGMDFSRFTYPKNFIWLVLGIMGIYTGLALLLWQYHYTLPIIIPLSTWSASAISTYVCLVMALQKKLIAQQRQAIEQLQHAEEKALMLQNRKLLQRVASDIHDTALQDIKVLMDKLELESNINSEYILERLELIGCQIREQLNSMRQVSQKLYISSLSSGLDSAIQNYLAELVTSGRLTLQVIDHIKPLDEPSADSNWIDAREDIYRFFKEAINNVLFHAQPPHGDATQVRISLWRSKNRCYLVVADNNSDNSCVSENNKMSEPPQFSGYGTKIMETIASELPGGTWQRVNSPKGGVEVKLSWLLISP